MRDVEAKLNTIADAIAAEGMIVRAAGVRAGAAEIARLRHKVHRLEAQLQPLLENWQRLQELINE